MSNYKLYPVFSLATLICILLNPALAQVEVDSLFSIPRIEDNYPHWSPDGEMIAFESNRSNGNMEIYIMTVEDKAIRQLTNSANEEETPVWSPDGSLIMYSSYLDEENIEIFLVNADGTNHKRITDHPLADGHAKFSPDGNRIIFCSQRDDNGEQELKNYELYTMNLDGSGIERLTHYPGWDTYPSYSLDGEKIIWRKLLKDSTTGAYNSEVFMMNKDLTQVTNLTNHPSYDAYPDWSPDGSRMFFQSDRPTEGTEAKDWDIWVSEKTDAGFGQ